MLVLVIIARILIRKNKMFDVKLFKNDGPGSRLAGGYLTVANCVKIKINLIKTKNGGYFVGFPSYQKQGTDEWVNYVDTVSKEAHAAVTKVVVEEYLKLTGQSVDHRGEDTQVEKPYNNNPSSEVVHAEPKQGGNNIPSGVPF